MISSRSLGSVGPKIPKSCSSAAGRRPATGKRTDFSRLLRGRWGASKEKNLALHCPSQAICLPEAYKVEQSSSLSAPPTLRADLEMLQERLFDACAQLRWLGGPLEISFSQGWLEGAIINLEMHQELLHCRIKAPAARQREQIRRAMARVAARLASSGLRLGGMEVGR